MNLLEFIRTMLEDKPASFVVAALLNTARRRPEHAHELHQAIIGIVADLESRIYDLDDELMQFEDEVL